MFVSMPTSRWSLIKIGKVDLFDLEEYLSDYYTPLIYRTPDDREGGWFGYIQDEREYDFKIQAENYYFINMIEDDPSILWDFDGHCHKQDFQDIKNVYQKYSRGAKNGLQSAMRELYANYTEHQDLGRAILVSDKTLFPDASIIYPIYDTYQLVGLIDKTKHLIEYLETKGLNENIIAHCLSKKYTEYIDWQWQIASPEDFVDYPSEDLERQSYIELGGNLENYREGCLDEFMDSLGF